VSPHDGGTIILAGLVGLFSPRLGFLVLLVWGVALAGATQTGVR
jgi:hypothetical protein